MTEKPSNKFPPEEFPRRILLMVTGRTPQVVTETLYALCVQRRPAFVPTEVHLITTAEGAQDARLTLLEGTHRWFHQLLSGLRPDRHRLPRGLHPRHSRP